MKCLNTCEHLNTEHPYFTTRSIHAEMDYRRPDRHAGCEHGSGRLHTGARSTARHKSVITGGAVCATGSGVDQQGAGAIQPRAADAAKEFERGGKLDGPRPGAEPPVLTHGPTGPQHPGAAAGIRLYRLAVD